MSPRDPIPRRRSRAPLWSISVLLFLTVPLASPAQTSVDAAWLAALANRDVERLAALLEAPGAGAAAIDIEAATDDGRTALMTAARAGHVDLVGALLAAGAEPSRRNDNGGSALMYAVLIPDNPAVPLLLDAGADPDTIARNGWSAVMIAAAKGSLTTLERLLAAGADPDRRDVYGWTPLMRAIAEGRHAVARRLIDTARLDLAARDESGWTALHHAAWHGDHRTAARLVGAGADAGATDLLGRTPADLASRNGHRALATLFREAGRAGLY